MSKFDDDMARGCLPTGEPLECAYGVGWWTEMPEEEPEPEPELKPCPRCGAEAHVVTEDGEPTMFLCEDCGSWLDVSEFETTENAFKWWNDRPFIDALNARIAELEAALEHVIEVGNYGWDVIRKYGWEEKEINWWNTASDKAYKCLRKGRRER